MQVFGQGTVNYGYDNANDLTTVSDVTSLGQGTLPVAINYDGAARPYCLTLPNSVVESYAYDQASRVNQISYGTGQCATPPASQPSNLGTLIYSYDNDSRISGVGGSLPAINLPAAVSSNSYGTTNDILGWNGVVKTYIDAANNVTLDPSNSAVYAWDSREQLASVTSPDYLFYYDALGRRETFDDFGIIESYLYDGAAGLQEASSNTGSLPTQNYLTLPGGGVVAVVTTAGSTSTTTVPLHDLLGSTIGLVNSAGAIATQYSYEPFGRPTTSGTASSFPYLFAGMEYDASTGLYHTPARYYSPVLQRFLSEDRLGFNGGDVNLAAYAGNDPVNMSDPSGLQEVGGGGCFGGVVAAATAVADINAIAVMATEAGQLSAALINPGIFRILIGQRVSLPPVGNDPQTITPGVPPGIVLTQGEGGGDDEDDPIRKQLEPDPEDMPLESTPSPGKPLKDPYLPFPIEGRQPRNEQERDAMHEAMKLAQEGEGREIMPGTKWIDQRFKEPGWHKYTYFLSSDEGNIEVHWMRNSITGEVTQFKFKYPQ